MTTTTAATKPPSTYEDIYSLHIHDGLTTAQIIAKYNGRLSLHTVRSYITQVIKDAKTRGDQIPMRKSHGGGFKSFTEQKPLSPMHSTIGIKLSRFRETQLKVTCKEFCETYSFASWIKLRQIELGVYELSLREIQRVAEILGITVQELLTPIGSAYASSRL